MIGLRQKLALGFGGLLLIALFVGLYGAMRIARLGTAIDIILQENYRSVLAMQEAKEALERMDSSILYALLGYRESSTQLRSTYDPPFRDALIIELGNITLEGEQERAERLGHLYEDYQRKLVQVLDESQPLATRRERYFSTVQPLFLKIKEEANAILQMNQETMIEAKKAAHQEAAQARRYLFLMLLCGVFIAAALTILTSRAILRPVRRLQRSANEIRQGNLDVIVAEDGNDELAHLAASFNAMTAYLRSIQRSDRGHLLRMQWATQLAIDHLPDAIVVLDPEGMVELSNETAQQCFNLLPDTTLDAELFALPSKGEVRLNDALHVFDGEDERFFLPQVIPVRDENHLQAGQILVLSDVTPLRRAYETHAGLLARIAHEISAPLTSLRIALNLLLEGEKDSLTSNQIELLQVARTDASKLGQLSRDLFALNYFSVREKSLVTTSVKPGKLIFAALRRMENVFRENDLLLHADVPAHLPKVQADAKYIEEVLEALLENALAHTPPGGDVHLAARPDAGDHVRFVLSDTGTPVLEKHRAHFFDRSHATSTDAPRADLRLIVAHDIVEAHGGHIAVNDGMSIGTTFTFTLPISDRASAS